METEFSHYLSLCQDRVNQALSLALSQLNNKAPSLQQAMEYSCLQGGKRIRPVLVYASAEVVGDTEPYLDDLDTVACAVEVVHAYSLIHDDLPAMDDDDLRRGKPTCHKAFDEATAILAGDALQTLAFSLIAESQLSDENKVRAVAILADAAGAKGMVAGQAVDLSSVGEQLTLQELEAMHQQKTGALIRASVALGAIAMNCNDNSVMGSLDDYATAIGLAFQVQDDILDEESDTQTLGKQQGADRALDKPTYAQLLGLQGAKEKLASLHQDSLKALAPLREKGKHLQQLADYIVARRH